MSVSVSIIGATSAKDKIQQVLKNVQEGSEKALDKGAEATLTQAKINCPVGTPESTGIPGYKGGTLKESLTIDDNEEGHRYLGSNVYYAEWVHEGTTKMDGRPFLTTAQEETKGEYVSAAKSIKVL